jgi:O6-methylguanine-DNA--protein-cysteine methyltransferase
MSDSFYSYIFSQGYAYCFLKFWNGLVNISYGKVISYKEQANYLKIPSAVRAVASALS